MALVPTVRIHAGGAMTTFVVYAYEKRHTLGSPAYLNSKRCYVVTMDIHRVKANGKLTYLFEARLAGHRTPLDRDHELYGALGALGQAVRHPRFVKRFAETANWRYEVTEADGKDLTSYFVK